MSIETKNTFEMEFPTALTVQRDENATIEFFVLADIQANCIFRLGILCECPGTLTILWVNIKEGLPWNCPLSVYSFDATSHWNVKKGKENGVVSCEARGKLGGETSLKRLNLLNFAMYPAVLCTNGVEWKYSLSYELGTCSLARNLQQDLSQISFCDCKRVKKISFEAVAHHVFSQPGVFFFASVAMRLLSGVIF